MECNYCMVSGEDWIFICFWWKQQHSCIFNEIPMSNIINSTIQTNDDPFSEAHTSIWSQAINNLNLVWGIATICHQVCCMHWGHPSLFYAATSLLNWYKMIWMANILHRLIWVKFMSMLSMYVQSGTNRHFHWRIIVVLTQNPTVLMFVDICGTPKTLVEICRNMGICCSFRAVAARRKYPGFMLFIVQVPTKQPWRYGGTKLVPKHNTTQWGLTHWGRDKMAAVSQTTLRKAFSWMQMLEFRLRFHWSLFLRVQLTIIQHWFR